jgi:hypothetical protein
MVRFPSLLLAMALVGCTGGTLFRGTDLPAIPDPGAPSATTPPSAGALSLYFDTLRNLTEGDAVLKADTFRNAAAAVDVTPTPANKLNLALALALPGHAASDAAAAQRALSDLLAASDVLLPEERVLALVHLKDVERVLGLDAEARRLSGAAQTTTAQRNNQSAQQLQAALEENRQLRLALDEARAKLDAITNIERSIRERDNAANPR